MGHWPHIDCAFAWINRRWNLSFSLFRLQAVMGRRFLMKWSWSGLLSWVSADVCPLTSPWSVMPLTSQHSPQSSLPHPVSHPLTPSPHKIRRLWRVWLQWNGIKKNFFKLTTLRVLLYSLAIHSMRTSKCHSCTTVANFSKSYLIFLAINLDIP